MTAFIQAAATALQTLKDTPLWLLIGCAIFLLLFPFLPGAAALANPIVFGCLRFAGYLLAILALCRLVALLPRVIKSWRDQLDKRRTLHLTLDDAASLWVCSPQKDGSVITQFSIRFMAKNRSNERVSLLKARIIKPRLLGEVVDSRVLVRLLHNNSFGTAEVSGTYIPAGDMLPALVSIAAHGSLKQTHGKLRVVLGITDENGKETRSTFDVSHASRR